MRRTLAVVCGASLLFLSAHRLPAPIEEQDDSPTEESTSPFNPERTKHKSNASSDFSLIGRFDGTWRATMASKNQSGTFNETKTVVIRDGTAVYTREVTATLIPGKMWSNYPAPYKTASPIYKKWIDKTTDIKLEGSNIRTRWPGNRLVDWSPKSIPASLLKQVAVGQPNTTISILSGQQLIVTSGKGAVTYTRVR